MFGISFTEIAVIATIALVVVGPQKLPVMLRTLGEWVRKLRRLTTEVRAQTGIDEILREEGIDGVRELRSLLRGEIAAAKQHQRGKQVEEPYTHLDFDPSREYPVEGPDAYHAVPDDLFDANAEPAAPEGNSREPESQITAHSNEPTTQPAAPSQGGTSASAESSPERHPDSPETPRAGSEPTSDYPALGASAPEPTGKPS